MRSTVFGKWVLRYPLKAYVILPAFLGVALVGLYFSHLSFLQNLVAPPVGSPGENILGGRGLLHLVQTFILLAGLFFTFRALISTRQWPVRIVTVLLLLLLISILMEELDFGTSLTGLMSGQSAYQGGNPGDAAYDINQSSGEQVAGLIKLGASAVVLVIFVLAPLAMSGSRNRTVKVLAPPLWILATVALSVIVARLAAMLNGAGLGTIADVQGALAYDIGEFGELMVYYLLMVYAAALHERVIAREDAWAPRRGVVD